MSQPSLPLVHTWIPGATDPLTSLLPESSIMSDTAIEKPIYAAFGKPPLHTWHSLLPILAQGSQRAGAVHFPALQWGC